MIFVGRNGSEQDRGSDQGSEDRPEEVVLEDENPAALHHGVVTEDIRLRILECAHPRWYDHLIRFSHKLSVD